MDKKNDLILKKRLKLQYQKVSTLLRELKGLKKQVIGERIKETRKLIAKNKSLLRFSTFELMEYNFNENTHSNILKYLFDFRINNDIGSKLLSKFIESLNIENALDFSQLVNKNKYLVEREKSVGNGRIDIFILDTRNRFVIVIENKIYAAIGERDEVDENELPITQLKIYQKFVEQFYPSYKKLYILLSHTPIEDEYPPFIITDYKNLYEVSGSIKTCDPIVEQYKLLLHSLVNNISDKSEIIEKISSLNTDCVIDLNTLELINGVLYARK